MVVMIVGLPGSGKSYFASRLAKQIDAVYINSDQERKKIFVSRTYSEKEKIAVYETMLTKMKDALKQNKNVVLDATFYKNNIRKKFTDKITDKIKIYFIFPILNC